MKENRICRPVQGPERSDLTAENWGRDFALVRLGIKLFSRPHVRSFLALSTLSNLSFRGWHLSITIITMYCPPQQPRGRDWWLGAVRGNAGTWGYEYGAAVIYSPNDDPSTVRSGWLLNDGRACAWPIISVLGRWFLQVGTAAATSIIMVLISNNVLNLNIATFDQMSLDLKVQSSSHPSR